MTKLLRRLRYWCDYHRHIFVARVFLACTPRLEGKPRLLSGGELEKLQGEKRERRNARLHELGLASIAAIEKERDELVSIGVFGCNRFEFLKTTCDSLAAFLKRYGNEFPHEVILFHDGPNPEIEAWARANPLFDRVFFNTESKGLAWNLNRFWFEESKGKYILDFEEDWVCEARDNFILNAIAILKDDEHIGLVRLERKYPADYRKWNEAFKIHARVLSERVFTTRTKPQHSYRILEGQENGEGIWANASGLIRFASLVVTGRQTDVRKKPRFQEQEYEKIYNTYWEAARGTRQKDNPFLHIGYGRSVPEPEA